MLPTWLKRYELNRKALGEDARIAGKALLAVAFAMGIYPGDESSERAPYTVLGLFVVGILVYLFGLRKTED